MDKNFLRSSLLKKRSLLSEEASARGGQALVRRLTALPEYEQAERIMAYVDFRNEIPTGPLLDRILADGKHPVLPRTDEAFRIWPLELPPGASSWQDRLVRSAFGVWEPDPAFWRVTDPRSIDLVIVPGIAFDGRGGRIGYGKGCYDRFLPALSPRALTIAVAYDFQVLPQVPVEEEDIPVDRLLILEASFSEE